MRITLMVLGLMFTSTGAFSAELSSAPPQRNIAPGLASYGPAKGMPARIGSPSATIDLPTPKREASDSRINSIGIGAMLGEQSSIRVAALTWVATDDQLIATVAVRSEGAKAMRVAITGLAAAPDVGLRVSGSLTPDQSQTINRIGIQDKSSIYWTPITAGEAQVIEFAVSRANAAQTAQLRIVGASHLESLPSYLDSSPFPKAYGAPGASLPCQVDVACVDGLHDLDASIKTAFDAKEKSTALLIFTTPSGGTASCSGTLIANDYHAALLLTAFHCLTSPDVAASLITVFNFQALQCGGTTYNVGSALTSGALWLNGSQALDQTLVLLYDTPPSGYVLSGYDAGGAYANGTLMMGMHHPRGDLKKTSLGTIIGLAPSFPSDGVTYAANNFYITSWKIGLVEHGSSGSGLFVVPTNASFFALIGTVNAGPTATSCPVSPSFENTYSRLDLFFPSIFRYLKSSYSFNYSDLWWNPNEPGWGLTISHQGDTLFVTWYTYDNAGNAAWFYIPNAAKSSTGVYSGQMYRVTGIPLNQVNGTAATTGAAASVGNGTLSFSSSGAGTFSYSVNGSSGSKQIQRYVFSSTPPACAFAIASTSGLKNYQEMWYDSAEPGWGLNIAHEGATIFATIFSYDQSGAPIWLAMPSGSQVSPTQFQGRLYKFSGLPFSQINGSAATTGTPLDIGSLTLTFASGSSGRMDYSINGATGSKTMSRFIFDVPFTTCQ